MDEEPTGCNVSVASLKLIPKSLINFQSPRFKNWNYTEIKGGEIYTPKDDKIAHQRDWDFLVEKLEKEFNKRGINSSSSILERLNVLVR